MKRLAVLALVVFTAACGESPVEPAGPAEADLIFLDADQFSSSQFPAVIGEGLSAGCALLNQSGFDGLYSGQTVNNRSFSAGEAVTVTAGPPTDFGVASVVLLFIFPDVAELSTSFPGTLTYIFPATGLYNLGWQAPRDNVTWSVSCAQATIPVSIDIKPGSDPNSINPRSMGVVPVAILGSETFDVTAVDLTTLAFGPSGASPRHDLTDPEVLFGHTHEEVCDESGENCVWEELDVNGDGKQDLVTHYRQKETGLASGDTDACITGETLSGTPIEGCDAVNVLGR
jgi:hypothetical protein